MNDELIIMPGAGKAALLMNSGVISGYGAVCGVFGGGGVRGKVETGEEGSGCSGQWSVSQEGRGGGAGVRLGELDEEFVYETKEGGIGLFWGASDVEGGKRIRFGSGVGGGGAPGS